MRKKNHNLKLKKTKEFQRFKQLLDPAKRVLLSTHAQPDGDGLGAECALYHYLKKAKKQVKIYNPDPVPGRYKFLDASSRFLHGPEDAKPWESFDLWMIVDTNDPKRLGKLWSELSLRAKNIVFLDHHMPLQGQPKMITYPPNTFCLSDPSTSSIGEMLDQIFEDLSLTSWNFDIALGLYVSVMTDTNSFRYARTTPEAHRIAAKTIQFGVNPEEIYQNIYSSKEVNHLKLLGILLQNVKVSKDGKIAWIEMQKNTRLKHRASTDDTLSFLNLLLLLKNAEVVLLFREDAKNKVRVSIKSKGKIQVSQLAMELGGGGHEFAAGAMLNVSLPLAVKKVTRRLQDLVST